MGEVKRMCKKAEKIALDVVVGVGLIGFVKGVFVGYLICHYKDKCSCQNIKCADTVLHQLDPQIIYPHYDFKHLTKSILKSE